MNLNTFIHYLCGHLLLSLYPFPLKQVDHPMYLAHKKGLKVMHWVIRLMFISNFKLQGAETVTNSNLVFPIFLGLILSIILSTILCWDRQGTHTMNMYTIIGLIVWLVIMWQIISCFLLNASKNNTSTLTLQIWKLFLKAFQILSSLFLSLNVARNRLELGLL